MAAAWKVALATAVVGWLVSPIIAFFLPMILSCLVFDPSEKLRQLKIRIMPELHKTLRAVDQARMLQMGEGSDVFMLNDMATRLRHAREDAEDIFDDAWEIQLYRNSCWQRLSAAVKACLRIILSRSQARLLQRRWRNSCLLDPVIAPSCSSFYVIKNSCRSILHWLQDAFVVARTYRNWSYGVVGITSSQENSLDYVITAISRWNLKKNIEKVESTISEVKKSPLLGARSKSTPDNTSYRNKFTPRDLECMLCDETADPLALPLYLLEEITAGFSDKQEIGRGSFAVVYKGILSQHGQLKTGIVAVKSMYDSTYKYEKEFRREVECLMTTKHKNVVRFLGYCCDTQVTMARKGEKFIMADVRKKLLCFEYLPKGNLHEYITDMSRKPAWRDCYQIIMGVCQGLHYLHQNKIVHFDLKPANILLDENLVAKITDFGLSRCFIGETESRVISKIGGTLGYLAPELFQKDLKVTRQESYRLDIYSLGVVIMEILTGKKDGCHVENIVERWRNMLEISQRDGQLEQVRVCAEIGIKCTDPDPTNRPDTQHIINRLHGTETMDEYIKTAAIPSKKAHSPNELRHDIPNSLGDTSSKENATTVTVAQRNTCNSDWENTINLDKVNETMHSLNPDIRRCIEFCTVFPRGWELRRDELVHLWTAQGFVKTSNAIDDMEDVAGWYITVLVSCSFLQPIKISSGTDCFTVHVVLHDILDKVARNCFRIENGSSHRGEGWEGDVPRHIHHLFVHSYDEELIAETIIGLKYLRTLIVYVVGKDTPIEEKVIDGICKRLPKLRVLAIAFSQEHDPIKQPNEFSFPESVGRLKHLRYFSFRTHRSCKLTLRNTLNKLQHIQLLDFGDGDISEFTFAKLVNLRHIFCWPYVKLPYVGRLSSLQTLPGFEVSNEQGCELKQLRDLNKLRGTLRISGLENVKSKGKALQANLHSKERLTELTLFWKYNGTTCSPEVETSVLEGLCPPAGLQILNISQYVGSRYPYWMVGEHIGGPKYLQELRLSKCNQSVPADGLAKAFPQLRLLQIYFCSWNALPNSMDHLTLLKTLEIFGCKNIRLLPSLPQTLECFMLGGCDDELSKSCQTVEHPNWKKIEHIPSKHIC